MKEGDMIKVSFTGKEQATGRVFDTTDEETAKKHDLFRENAVYKPTTVIVGRGSLLKGLDEALLGMKPGEKKAIELPPEKAFGSRKKELVVVVPLQEFKKRKINPVPGLIVNVNNQYGKVQTVSGGRVRVDFNSDLAGKIVEYELSAGQLITKPADKVEALLEKFFPFKGKPAKADITGKEVEVRLPENLPPEVAGLKEVFAKTVTDNVEGIDKVRFVEEFEKKAGQEKGGKEEEGAGKGKKAEGENREEAKGESREEGEKTKGQ